VSRAGWRGQVVAVTGAGGFVGGHLVEELLRRGARVRALVRYASHGGAGWLDDCPARLRRGLIVERGDVRNPARVRALVEGADVLFHLAAVISVPWSFVDPREVIEVNVLGTLTVLEAAREARTPRVVQVSSSEVYGTPRTMPIREDHPLHPQSPYAASKVAGDRLAESFHDAYGLRVVVARPFNMYGPRQSARAIVPAIASQALTGDVVRIGATRPRRDLTYVSDTVAGLLAVAESRLVRETVQFGSGHEVSVGELAQHIIRIANPRARIVPDRGRLRPRAAEVDRLLCDATKARTLLRWRPRVTLEQGLARVVDWIRRHPERYRPSEYAR
jgi:dTDP-glucose 4,6-dehydratase